MSSEKQMIDTLIWRELVHAKSWEQYISDYTGYRIDWRKWFSIISVSLAIIGGSTWSIWKAIDATWVNPVLFAIIGVVQILTAIQKEVVIDSKTIEQLGKLRGMYILCFNELERLYILSYEYRIELEDLEKAYFEIKESTIPIENLKDSINIKPLKKLKAGVSVKVETFLENRYLTTSPEKLPQ